MNVSQALSVTLFLLISVLSFSVWAFGGRLFPNEPSMYAGCAVVFLGLGGAALLPASGLKGKPAVTFCISFAVAYLVYAIIWSFAWFSLPNTYGEVFGSSLGLLAFAAILIKWNRLSVSLLVATAVLFLFHTVGYYLGGLVYQVITDGLKLGIEFGPANPQTTRLIAKLSWGAGYGLGLGVGITTILYLSRQSSARPSTQI